MFVGLEITKEQAKALWHNKDVFAYTLHERVDWCINDNNEPISRLEEEDYDVLFIENNG